MPEGLRSAASKPRTLFRGLPHAKGTVAGCVLVLALGLGTVLAAFTLIDGTLLKGLPYTAPEQLVALTWEASQGRQEGTPIALVDDLAEESRLAQGFAGYRSLQAVALDAYEERELFPAWQVSWNFLELLGCRPDQGAFFTREQEEVGNPVVVISHRLWRAYFHGDAGMVGKPILLNGQPWTVIGVAPPGLELPGNARVDLFLPLDRVRDRVDYVSATHRWIARMKPRSTRTAFQSELKDILRKREASQPSQRGKGQTLLIEDLQRSLLGQESLLTLAMLALAALLLLLLCNGVARLFLVRRQDEPSPAPSLRQLLLATMGMGLAATLLALGLVALLQKAMPPLQGGFQQLNGIARLGVDARVLAFSLGLGVLEGVVLARFTWRGQRGDEPTKTFLPSAKTRLQVLALSTLALLMLTLAGLFIKSFLRAIQVDPGFDPRGLYALKVQLPETRYDWGSLPSFQETLLKALAGLPDVDSLSAASSDPLTGSLDALEGQEVRAEKPWRRVLVNHVSEGSFEALRIHLLRGRGLQQGDATGVVINEAFARDFFPGLNPLGQRLRVRGFLPGQPTLAKEVEVLGVGRDTRSDGPPAAVQPRLSLLFSGFPSRTFSVLLRSSQSLPLLQRAVTGQCLALDPYLNADHLESLESLAASHGARLRLNAVLMGISALLTLLLATQPLRSLLSRVFASRVEELDTHPMWDRSGGLLLRKSLLQITLYSGLGALLGVGSALVIGRVLSRHLQGQAVIDPGIILLAFFLFGSTGGLLGLFPALRANREASKRQAREAQWVQLKGQLNPHVFFNAMNNLTALIRKDPVLAEQAAEDLTSLFRRLMAHGHRPVAPLGDERALLETYLAVEGLRFGPRLRVVWEWDPALDAVMAPPFLVQPLVENAIKHGLAPAPEGGELLIRGRLVDGFVTLRVENTGYPLTAREPGGLGLENLESRLRLFYPRNAHFRLVAEPPRTLAEVQFPLLQELP